MAGYRIRETVVTSDAGEESAIVVKGGVKVPPDDISLTVGEVEKLTGTSKETLRFYDKKGLLCPVRTGEGVSNNRKLYSADDLVRLQSIQALRTYNFSLDEIAQVFDGNADIHQVMLEKLCELKIVESRLRSLMLFAGFVNLTNEDLIEGLANGPSDIDAFADFVRETPNHENVLQKLDKMSDKEAESALDALGPTLFKLTVADNADDIEKLVTEFFDWWNSFIAPVESNGYLGFWAVFEDHSLVAEYAEYTCQSGAPAFIEMYTFFVVLSRFARENNGLISRVAELADSDVIAAMEEAQELIADISRVMFGNEAASITLEARACLAHRMLIYLGGFSHDEELRDFPGFADGPLSDWRILKKVLSVLDLIGSEG